MHFSIHELLKKHKHRMSYTTFSDRTQRLESMTKELHQLGYEPTHIKRIKPKHIDILVKHWKDSGASVGTIKNRMSDLRFVCSELNRGNVVRSNDEYQIGKRSYVPTENKAIRSPKLDKITDDHIRCAVEL